jgi:hypothetical protein
MSSSSEHRDRTEARRRARLAARGELAPEPEGEPDGAADQPRQTILGRLFPAAPPLPDKPDPLAGFDESGPMRPIRVRAFLLRSNLAAWLLPGILAFLGYFASLFFGPQSFISLLGTFVLFGGLIAAGWFGWQRPTLFGTAAAILSFLLVTAFVLYFSLQLGVTPDAFGTPEEVISGLFVQGTFQAALGFLGGWYGGYLRRRQTQIGSTTRRRR